jgi:hypothetical protein
MLRSAAGLAGELVADGAAAGAETGNGGVVFT